MCIYFGKVIIGIVKSRIQLEFGNNGNNGKNFNDSLSFLKIFGIRRFRGNLLRMKSSLKENEYLLFLCGVEVLNILTHAFRHSRNMKRSSLFIFKILEVVITLFYALLYFN